MVKRWSPHARKDSAYVWQQGRFADDIDFWSNGLSDSTNIKTVDVTDSCLSFSLTTKEDFDFFHAAVTEELLTTVWTVGEPMLDKRLRVNLVLNLQLQLLRDFLAFNTSARPVEVYRKLYMHHELLSSFGSLRLPPQELLLKTSGKLVVECEAISTDGMRNKPRIPIFVMF